MPQKRQLSEEEIIQAVREYKTGRTSAAKLAQRSGVNESTVRRWIKAYEAEGAKAFEPHERNRAYSEEEKAEAVRAYLAGEGSQEEIARRYKIRSTKQLNNWVKVYNAHGDFRSCIHKCKRQR